MSPELQTYLLIGVPCVLGIFWAIYEVARLAAVKLDGHKDRLVGNDVENGEKAARSLALMNEISGYIARGATAFLYKEYQYMAVYIIAFNVLLFFQVDVYSCISFTVGAITSIFSGFIGMKVAVYANVRTAHEAWVDLGRGYNMAIAGGAALGFALVALGIINMFALILVFGMKINDEVELYEALAGYGLGGSSVALFARVGGGIYTKAADVGADLSGKNEYGMDEDDPRNPACIADNVGDNVGDVAGMSADLFGSFAESTCAALVIAAASAQIVNEHGENVHNKHSLVQNLASLTYPLLLSASGIISGLLTMISVGFIYKIRDLADIEKGLKGILIISTVLQTPITIWLSYAVLPAEFALDAQFTTVTPKYCWIAVLLGSWSGLIIGFTTEYYTSHSYAPVRDIARSQIVSGATGIIFGLAVGYMSCVIPVACLGVTILVSHQLAGMYGVALGALGMLSTMTCALTIDVYGPISDNAGGIAEMSELGPDVRRRTDALDAAGNTTAAVGKGFAIGSAALVSLALFGAFCVRAKVTTVNILDPWTFTGLLFGAMIPYAFSALTMRSVGEAANDMVNECLRQFPKIVNEGAKPDYDGCIAISTEASLREMILPGAIVLLSPIISGVLLGKNCTAGLLSGGLVSGVQMAISMSNTGGAWDNAKKYIESGGLGSMHGKGSAAHKNAVTGDTVGDPLKDTSGPAINIVMKLSAITSLVFASVINDYSNSEGGPFWLHV